MSAVTYTCTLSADGLADLVVPISSFQMRLRQSPLQCYLSAVVPGALTYADGIAARASGEITITQDDGGSETEILTANINAVRYQYGASNRAVTIVGYKQITFPATGSTTIAQPEYRALDAGTYRFRARPEADLKPGDEAVITGWETVIVGEISWSVGGARSVMEFDASTS